MTLVEMEKHTGIERSYLSRMKNGQRKRVGWETGMKISKLTGLDLETIVSLPVEELYEALVKAIDEKGIEE